MELSKVKKQPAREGAMGGDSAFVSQQRANEPKDTRLHTRLDGQAWCMHAWTWMGMDGHEHGRGHGRGWTSIVPVAVPDLEPRPGRRWWWGGCTEGMRVGFPPPGEPLHPTMSPFVGWARVAGISTALGLHVPLHSGNVGLEHRSTRTNPVARITLTMDKLCPESHNPTFLHWLPRALHTWPGSSVLKNRQIRGSGFLHTSRLPPSVPMLYCPV